MELCCDIRNNAKANKIISIYKKVSKSAALDVITALNSMVETTGTMETVIERLEIAYTMCTYMEPAVEDMVALLLHVSYGNNKASFNMFTKWFRDNRAKRYYEWTVEAYKNAERNDTLTRIEQIDYYIMMRVCDRMMDSIIRTMNKRGVPDTINVFEAYNLAKKAHYWVSRKSGEPYLTHPISVAGILADVGVESSIISAALLHDVVEDTDYTLDDIADKCGVLISKYVDAVTSVHRQYEASHNRSELAYDKAELDAKSFEKLAEAVAMEPRMVFALYIKAADRIHNLRTIDKMASEKKHDKTDETELDYLPLFKRFKLNYFVNVIEDLTWRTNNSEYYESIKGKYEDIIDRNSAYVEETKNILISRLGESFNHFCASRGVIEGKFDITIAKRYYLTREVYGFIKDALGNNKAITTDDVNKRNIPVCDFDIIVESNDASCTMDNFITMFVKMFMEQIVPTGRTIIDLNVDEHKRFIVKIEDRHRAVFRLCFSTRDDYIAYKIGSSKGATEVETDDDDMISPKEIIFVRLRNGKTIPLPNGATVLDVAFAIHPEVGLAVKSAVINGNKASIYHRVHDGDHVIVESDTYREDGVTKKLIHHERIGWLNYVATEKARKVIIRHLVKKYEEDDPKDEYNASNVATENVVNALEATLKDNEVFKSIN